MTFASSLQRSLPTRSEVFAPSLLNNLSIAQQVPIVESFLMSPAPKALDWPDWLQRIYSGLRPNGNLSLEDRVQWTLQQLIALLDQQDMRVSAAGPQKGPSEAQLLSVKARLPSIAQQLVSRVEQRAVAAVFEQQPEQQSGLPSKVEHAVDEFGAIQEWMQKQLMAEVGETIPALSVYLHGAQQPRIRSARSIVEDNAVSTRQPLPRIEKIEKMRGAEDGSEFSAWWYDNKTSEQKQVEFEVSGLIDRRITVVLYHGRPAGSSVELSASGSNVPQSSAAVQQKPSAADLENAASSPYPPETPAPLIKPPLSLAASPPQSATIGAKHQFKQTADVTVNATLSALSVTLAGRSVRIWVDDQIDRQKLVSAAADEAVSKPLDPVRLDPEHVARTVSRMLPIVEEVAGPIWGLIPDLEARSSVIPASSPLDILYVNPSSLDVARLPAHPRGYVSPQDVFTPDFIRKIDSVDPAGVAQASGYNQALLVWILDVPVQPIGSASDVLGNAEGLKERSFAHELTHLAQLFGVLGQRQPSWDPALREGVAEAVAQMVLEKLFQNAPLSRDFLNEDLRRWLLDTTCSLDLSNPDEVGLCGTSSYPRMHVFLQFLFRHYGVNALLNALRGAPDLPGLSRLDHALKTLGETKPLSEVLRQFGGSLALGQLSEALHRQGYGFPARIEGGFQLRPYDLSRILTANEIRIVNGEGRPLPDSLPWYGHAAQALDSVSGTFKKTFTIPPGYTLSVFKTTAPVPSSTQDIVRIRDEP